MTIKNISKKIINVGTTPLMPDETMEVNGSVMDTPAMKAHVRLGQIKTVAAKSAKPAKPAKSGSEPPAQDSPAPDAVPEGTAADQK